VLGAACYLCQRPTGTQWNDEEGGREAEKQSGIKVRFFVSHEGFDGLVELKLHSFFSSTLDESKLSTSCSRLRLKCDGTHEETRFRVSAKRTSPFKSTGASVQSTTGSRGARNSGSNAAYTMFRGSVKGTG
jgi:hypothetical protein